MGLSTWQDVTRTFMFPIRFWPQGQRLLSCLNVWPVTSVSFYIDITYLTHGYITMIGCVKYIHGSDTFSQGQIYMVYDIVLCSGHGFLSFDIVILCLARECITMVRFVAYIHELCMTLALEFNKLYLHHGFDRRSGVEVERLPRIREIGVRSPVATDLRRKNRWW